MSRAGKDGQQLDNAIVGANVSGMRPACPGA